MIADGKEVASYVDESQFQAGHSQMKCGYYAIWQNHFAGQPGKPAAGSGADIEREADKSYVKYDGADVPSNPRGMSLPQLYALIKEIGNHYQNLWPDALSKIDKDLIVAWIRAGYPVIVAVDEASIRDMSLQYSNPYAWNPDPGQYSHIITITGVQPNGIDFLCRDTANIDEHGVRPGPRRYARTQMELISATVFVPSWLPRPVSVRPSPQPAPQAVDWRKKAEDSLAQLSEALKHL